MTSLEQALTSHRKQKSIESQRAFWREFVIAKLLLPVSGTINQTAAVHNIPALCTRTPEGVGVLPVFTSELQLLKWKNQGQTYVELGGLQICELAKTMFDVEIIGVNIADPPVAFLDKNDIGALERVMNFGPPHER